MKNFILLSILLLVFSCKKEEQRFPRTSEELKAAEKAFRLKQVENCDSEVTQLLCLGKWEFDTLKLKHAYFPDNVIFECLGTYTSKPESSFRSDKYILKTWHIKSDTLFMDCPVHYYDSKFHHKYLINKKGERLKLIDLDNQKGHNHNYPICNCPLDFSPPKPNLQWMLDSFHNSKYKAIE